MRIFIKIFLFLCDQVDLGKESRLRKEAEQRMEEAELRAEEAEAEINRLRDEMEAGKRDYEEQLETVLQERASTISKMTNEVALSV